MRHRLADAIKTSLVVGTIVTLANQYDALSGETPFAPPKAIVSYLVPVAVSLYASRPRRA